MSEKVMRLVPDTGIPAIAFGAAWNESIDFYWSLAGSPPLQIRIRWYPDIDHDRRGHCVWAATATRLEPNADTHVPLFPQAGFPSIRPVEQRLIVAETIAVHLPADVRPGDSLQVQLYRDAISPDDTMCGDAVIVEAIATDDDRAWLREHGWNGR